MLHGRSRSDERESAECQSLMSIHDAISQGTISERHREGGASSKQTEKSIELRHGAAASAQSTVRSSAFA
jgi:hypothetical protein